MRIGFCRYCKRDLYEDYNYHGFCNIGCCSEFSYEQNISYAEAIDTDFNDGERKDLEDYITELENSCGSSSGAAHELERVVDRAKDEILVLKDKVKELRNLDWEKIKKERDNESAYNDSVLRKVNNIKEENDKIKEETEQVKKDNVILLDQNTDLLNIIKNMKAHSSRFQQLDLDIRLDYDE